jgi:hypothetical protein
LLDLFVLDVRGGFVSTVQLFLSAVTAEFRTYRDALRGDLDRHNVTVKVQEDFIATGTETLDKLDRYIRECDAVIHLIGDMTGAMAQHPSVAIIREHYPDFGRRLPLSEFLEPAGPLLPYTQWEAWLALYHRKVLVIAIPEEAAPRGERYASDESQRAIQRLHLARLESVERYPEIRFANADRLAIDVLRSPLQDLLAAASADALAPGAAAPGALTIDRVGVTQQQPRKHEDYFTEKKCIVDFWVTNRGGSQVVVLGVDFEVLETGRAELVKGPMPSSATYDLDLTDITTAAQHAECATSQIIAPGESDRFSIALVARLGLGVFAAWRLRPTLKTNFGDVPAPPVEMWLPFVDGDTSFEELMRFARMERESRDVHAALESKDGERLLKLFNEMPLEISTSGQMTFALSSAAQDEAFARQLGTRLLSLCTALAEQASDPYAAAELWVACARLRQAEHEGDRVFECLERALLAAPGHQDAVNLLIEQVNEGMANDRNLARILSVLTSQVQSGDVDPIVLQDVAVAAEKKS